MVKSLYLSAIALFAVFAGIEALPWSGTTDVTYGVNISPRAVEGPLEDRDELQKRFDAGCQGFSLAPYADGNQSYWSFIAQTVAQHFYEPNQQVIIDVHGDAQVSICNIDLTHRGYAYSWEIAAAVQWILTNCKNPTTGLLGGQAPIAHKGNLIVGVQNAAWVVDPEGPVTELLKYQTDFKRSALELN